MKKERQSKRRRSTEDDNRYPDVVVSAVSADQPSSLQVVQPIFADNYVPTPGDISNLLGKIDDHHSSQQVGAALEALNQLNEWSKKEEIRSIVLEIFFCFGGIARVLDFLNSTMQNRNCVIGSTEFLSFILSFRWNALEVNKNLAIEMAKMIVRCNGIQVLLRASHEYTVGNRISSATKHIWIALGRTINGDETRKVVDKKETIICILNHATNCISKLEEIGKQQDNGWTMDVFQAVLYAMANTIKDDRIGREELKQTNIVPVCLKALKNDCLIRNEDVVMFTLGTLAICSRKKALTKKKEFEQLLPTLVHCIGYFRENNQIISFVLSLLEIACGKLPKKSMEDAGVLEAISAAILKPGPTSEETKEKARSIMRAILK